MDLSLTLTQRRAVIRGWRGSSWHSDSHPGPRGSCPGPQLSATSGTPRGPDPHAGIPTTHSWRFRPEIFYNFCSVVDPDPDKYQYVFGTPGSRSVITGICTDPDPSIIKQKYKTTLDFYCFITSSWLFIFVKNCKYTFKSNEQKARKKIFFVGILNVTDEKCRIRVHNSVVRIRGFVPVPEPNVMDPQH